MALDKIKTAMIEDAAVTAAKAAADVATTASVTAAESDADKIQTNLAVLAFKVAVNNDLVKYSLKDQIIDEFEDASGVDASASTNETLTSGVYSAESGANPTGGDSVTSGVPSGYTVHRFDNTAATEQLVVTTAGTVDVLVVAGGGSGGSGYGAGAGAGGLVWKTGHTLTAATYDAVIGAGGAAQSTNSTRGITGVDSTWTINGGSVVFTAKGGGGGGRAGGSGDSAFDGGSGGGGGYNLAAGGSTIQASAGTNGTYGFGYNGAAANASPSGNYNTGGGGGAGGAGDVGDAAESGIGGIGKDLSSFFGTTVGESGWFASGGGGGWVSDGNSVAGTASNGGGTAGGTPSGGDSAAAQANTGGGSGGGAEGGNSGAGGSGVILVRYLTASAFVVVDNLTLQSTDTAAETEPDYADMVMLIEDAAGTATINTDIKGFISEDSGVTFTEGVLVDEGDWGTNKRILAFHDLDISAQSGTAMCYKIRTYNQTASKSTKIHAASIGWR